MLVRMLLGESHRPFFTVKVMAWLVVEEVNRGHPELGLDSNVPLAKMLSTSFDMAKYSQFCEQKDPLSLKLVLLTDML